jgi:ribosomal protein S18 acetylase RimI-like enzyme
MGNSDMLIDLDRKEKGLKAQRYTVGGVQIIPFKDSDHRDQVIEIWRRIFGYEDARNSPGLVIDKKVEASDGLFFVAVFGGEVIGTVMAGYDGHRGWIYLLAVIPDYRRRGIGSALIRCAEDELTQRGCVKINLQILESNESVMKFYILNGYAAEKRINMGKQFSENI